MLNNGLIDPRELKTFLFGLKTKALEVERSSVGIVKHTMFARVHALDAILVFLNSKMEANDMEKLDLTMGSKPVPTKEVKAETEAQQELSRQLAEIAKTVPVGHSQPLPGVTGDRIKSVASKIWTLRTEGRLPKDIKPTMQKGKLFLQRMTPEELAKMRQGKKNVAKAKE